MKSTVDLYEFRESFRRFGRADNFSHEGLELLFDYLEEIDPDMELDVIALCCDFCEMTTAEIINDYCVEIDADADADEIADAVREYLQENTSIVGETSTGFVFAQF